MDSSLQWTLWKELFQSGQRVVSLPECDWWLRGCHAEATADLSPYCADCSAYYVAVAASVWQSALGRGKEKEDENTSEYQALSIYFFKFGY